MQINIGDDITINAKVIDITTSGNVIIKTKKGGKILISPDEINTIRPKIENDGADMRGDNK